MSGSTTMQQVIIPGLLSAAILAGAGFFVSAQAEIAVLQTEIQQLRTDTQRIGDGVEAIMGEIARIHPRTN